MPKTLFILNDPPYGTERNYNGLRLANALAKRDGEEVKVFLIGDAVACAKAGRTFPAVTTRSRTWSAPRPVAVRSAYAEPVWTREASRPPSSPQTRSEAPSMD